ncbi:GDP-mannose 4,6-dehydratase [Myxococcota bacterium]
MPTAVICGVTGQDGAYLAQLLLSKGYRVVGTSRDAGAPRSRNLEQLGIADQVPIVSAALTDFRSVVQLLTKYPPDELYNLAGQSSVSLSFEQPVETLESIGHGAVTLLEAIRFFGRPIRFFNAGSAECFGESPMPCDEQTPFRPRSPYGVAKTTAYWAALNYREAYGLYACTGILFNHESPLRPPRFVTRKIVAAACRIAAGSDETLYLGNIDVQRDWGWAPEYVDAMWRMLQLDEPRDIVIGTGFTCSLSDFVASAFQQVGLDWRRHVESNADLIRPLEIRRGHGNPALARELLAWEATVRGEQVVARMIRAEQKLQSGQPLACADLC